MSSMTFKLRTCVHDSICDAFLTLLYNDHINGNLPFPASARFLRPLETSIGDLLEEFSYEHIQKNK